MLRRGLAYRTVTRINCGTPAVIYYRMPGTTPDGCNFGSATPT